jgi:hypothetical protein
MSAKIISHTDGIVTVKITGVFTYPDQLALQNATADMLSEQRKISVLTIYEDFQGWSKDDNWEDVSFQEQSDPYIKKMAIFKPVILAWMPESSATDGNCMMLNNSILRTVSKPSLRSPCDWIPASMLELRCF